MKKTIVNLAVGSVLALGAVAANASALTSADILSIDLGIGGFGVPPAAGTGSYFGMETGAAGSPILYTPIVGVDGVTLDGSPQFSEAENVDGNLGNNSAVVSVDAAWDFFGALGSHGTTGISISDNSAAGAVDLDFSGWYVSYNNIALISMGGDPANFPADTQIANIVCDSDCSVGTGYTLDYSAHVPLSSAAFPGTAYVLHLEGTVQSAVPVPAAVWLFGSGLLGLVGVARRKKTV